MLKLPSEWRWLQWSRRGLAHIDGAPLGRAQTALCGVLIPHQDAYSPSILQDDDEQFWCCKNCIRAAKQLGINSEQQISVMYYAPDTFAGTRIQGRSADIVIVDDAIRVPQ